MKLSLLFLFSMVLLGFTPARQTSIRLRYVAKATEVRKTLKETSPVIGLIKPQDKIFLEYTLGKIARIEFYNPNGKLINGYVSADLLLKEPVPPTSPSVKENPVQSTRPRTTN